MRRRRQRIGRAVAVEQDDAEETRAAVESEGRRALLLPGDVLALPGGETTG